MPARQISVTPDQAKALMDLLATQFLRISRELGRLEELERISPKSALIVRRRQKAALLRPIWEQLKECV